MLTFLIMVIYCSRPRKKGVVRDKSVHIEVIQMIVDYVRSIGFGILGLDYSPVKGPEGNIEYLIYLQNNLDLDLEKDIEEVVESSHGELDK